MITKHRTGHLFKRGSVFYLKYMLEGKIVRKALKDEQGNPITTAKAAETKRQEIMAPFMVATKENALRTVKHQLDDTVAQREFSEQKGHAPLALKQAWNAYVGAVNRPDSGSRTLDGYEAQWRQFVDWMSQKHPAVAFLPAVDPEIAQEYARYLLSEVKTTVHRKRRKKEWDEVKMLKPAFSTNTYNKHIRVLELVFRVLSQKAGITVNPWSDISRKTENKASRRELTVEELTTICNKASGELQALLLLGIYTGLRLGDCCTLRWSEVDVVRRIILRVPNKTARRRNSPVHIPIHPTLYTFVAQTPKSRRSGYVLPDIAEKYKNNSSDVTKELRLHFKACGIQVHKDGTGFKRVPSKGERQKNVHTGTRAVVEVGFHSLRHSFVSLCRQSNAPLAVVEAIVGHSNPAMTRHYTHVGDLAASQAVAALPAIGGVADDSAKVVAPAKDGLGESLEEALKALDSTNQQNWEQQIATVSALVRQAIEEFRRCGTGPKT